MGSKVRIILGILLVSILGYQTECASLNHYRFARDVESPVFNTSLTANFTTESSPSSTQKISKETDKNSNKIEDKTVDLIQNENVKTSVEEPVPPVKEITTSRGSVKFHTQSEEKVTTEEPKQQNKEEESKQSKDVNKEELRVTGRSLNIDIEKYVSPEFHNKNNVYSLPTSPEIEKYIGQDSDEFSEDITTKSSPRRTFTSRTTRNDFNTDLTTPQSNIFDNKFQMLVDGIKQNLDEYGTSTDQDETTSNYEVPKLIDNYNNADNETDVTIRTKEFRNIEIKSDKNKSNKDEESGKNIEYESTHLKTRMYSDNSTEKSTTFAPSKRPKFQISLRNNTIETTASESEQKPKSVKHFSFESSSLDPITYSKPINENAINISKRGSTKFADSKTTTPSFMDFDNKNFSIPPTASAWTLVSLKDLPVSTSEINKSDSSSEQNSQENDLVKVQLTSPIKKEVTTISNPVEEELKSTTKLDSIVTIVDETTTGNVDTTTENVDTTTGNIETTIPNESRTMNMLQSDQPRNNTEESTINYSNSDMTTTEDLTTTMEDFTTTIEDLKTTMEDLTTTIEDLTTTEINVTTNQEEISTIVSNTNVTETEITTELPETSTESIKFYPTKTEIENELYTTLKSETSSNISESTTQIKTTEKLQKISTISETDDDILEEDFTEVFLKDRSTTTANPNEIEIVPVEHSPKISTTEKLNESKTTISTVNKDQKAILPNNYDVENTTIDLSSSTDMLSHDDSPEENNSGMIAAIAISCVGGVCLVLLAGLLLIMRKRQKRVTYGQRCRPVSLDAYSLDNVSVYNSVRRKGALRASKRSYGNPAFDDPASISHQMNFQVLVKFADNFEGISSEFDEIPQVTARANEVPPGCETKNRYANVIPLPETRVFLKASDNDPYSDYINANYVTGPKNIRGYYIACQAPMQNTVDDFWRMIWEQQSRVILMLTNLYENGIEKCADYLPPSEVVDCHRLFGDFQITLKKREVKEKYIISTLQLKNMVSNSWREVTHLWYLGWPERGVPTEANSLIAFLIEARSHLKTASNNNSSNNKTSESSNQYISKAASSNGNGTPEGGPMVVHCSPGTGRTGTVIACDVAIRDFELTRSVDVPKIVYRVRRDRASAVQTRDQYAFIYKVISLYATKLTGGALDAI